MANGVDIKIGENKFENIKTIKIKKNDNLGYQEYIVKGELAEKEDEISTLRSTNEGLNAEILEKNSQISTLSSEISSLGNIIVSEEPSSRLIFENFNNDNKTCSVKCQTSGTDINIVIPKFIKNDNKVYKVAAVSADGFKNCSDIKSIEVPNSIETIPEGAFSGCSSLESITLPFVGRRIKTSSDTEQYPFGYIFGENSYDGGVETQQTYYGSSTSETTNNIYYIPSSLKEIAILSGNILRGAFFNCSNIEKINLPNNITSISSSAFSNCSSLTSITIPSSVTSIGSGAFYNCSSLTSITIPNSITDISYNVFRSCSSLVDITIPSGVTSIDNYAFSYCSSLTSITIPSNVASIGKEAFSNCSSLTSIIIPSSVTSIGSGAFYNCSSLTDVYYDGTISGWCNIAFSYYDSNPMYYAKLYYAKHFYLKNSNSEYEELTELNIPNDITEIKAYTFAGFNNVTKVSMPSSVTSIGDSAFYNCRSLTSVYYDGTISDWCKISFNSPNPMSYASHFYIKNSNSEYEELTELNIPNDITEIKDYTFFGFNNVTKVNIPSRVTSIGKRTFEHCNSLTNLTFGENSQLTSIGEYAFSDCSSLASIEIPSSVTSTGDYVFYDCINLTNITLPTNINYTYLTNLFSGCGNLKKITIPSNIQYINFDAFSGCYRLTEIYNLSSVDLSNLLLESANSTGAFRVRSIYSSSTSTSKLITNNNFVYYIDGSEKIAIGPENINIESIVLSEQYCNKIDSYTFLNCRNLKYIKLPSSITENLSPKEIFKDCYNLESIEVDSNNTVYKSIKSSENIFNEEIFYSLYSQDEKELIFHPANNPATKLKISDNIEYIRSGAFHNCHNLKKVTFGNGSKIKEFNFSGCTSLKSILLPSNITSIGNNAFYNCNSLSDVLLQTGIETIGNNAFYDCNSLSYINIPDAVTSIGSSAFSGCSNLKNIEIPNTVTTIGTGAFFRCYSLDNIQLSNSINIIEESTFKNCYNLTNIIIPENVTNIKNGAFDSCYSLTSIIIPKNVTTIENNAFNSCYRLVEVYNLSNLNVSISSSNNGSLGKYAKAVYTSLDTQSKIKITEPNNKDYSTVYYIDGDEKILIKPKNINTSVIVIDDDCKKINKYAFYDCTNLTDIFLKESALIEVENIGNEYYNNAKKNFLKNKEHFVDIYNKIMKNSEDIIESHEEIIRYYEDGILDFYKGLTKDNRIVSPSIALDEILTLFGIRYGEQ